MKIENFLKVVLNLLWVWHVGTLELDNNTDIEFDQITRQPLTYFPQPRIVGGKDAKNNQFPYQISLRIDNYHICGGSIISENYIVTAAHCVTIVSGNNIRKITVRSGSREVNFGGKIFQVAEVKIHPNYRNFNNDIAVLKLSKPLVFDNGVQAIPLAKHTPKEGTTVIATGWGRLRSGGFISQILQFNILKVISNEECKQRIGNIPTSVLCLGHTVGNGVCSGDSGGPAVYNNQLIGVTNFIVGTCGSTAPDGYANVAFFYDWILINTDLK